MAGQAGTAGTGGGGGGGCNLNGGTGGNGGSGLVVVQYRAPFAYFTGGTIAITDAADGNGTIVTHTFNSPGTYYLAPNS